MDLLLAEQKEFDTLYFDRSSWDRGSWRDQKARHILENIAQAQLKLVGGDVQVIIDEAIPDLAMYRSQLINTFYLPPEAIEPKQGVRTFTLLSHAYPHVMQAAGELGDYLEPQEHQAVPPAIGHIERAAASLHIAAVGLAGMYLLDLEAAHRARLTQLSAGTVA